MIFGINDILFKNQMFLKYILLKVEEIILLLHDFEKDSYSDYIVSIGPMPLLIDTDLILIQSRIM